MIWKHQLSLEGLNNFCANTLMEPLGITFTAIGDDYLEATMPVDHRTHQPMGLLHGGASVALAETVGSMASALLVDPATHYTVGVEINASHLRGIRSGFVVARATPIRLGRTLHVWQIQIADPDGKLVCTCRLTMAVMPTNG